MSRNVILAVKDAKSFFSMGLLLSFVDALDVGAPLFIRGIPDGPCQTPRPTEGFGLSALCKGDEKIKPQFILQRQGLLKMRSANGRASFG